MVPVGMAGNEQMWLKSLHTMSNANSFATQDSQLAG